MIDLNISLNGQFSAHWTLHFKLLSQLKLYRNKMQPIFVPLEFWHKENHNCQFWKSIIFQNQQQTKKKLCKRWMDFNFYAFWCEPKQKIIFNHNVIHTFTILSMFYQNRKSRVVRISAQITLTGHNN